MLKSPVALPTAAHSEYAALEEKAFLKDFYVKRKDSSEKQTDGFLFFAETLHFEG